MRGFIATGSISLACGREAGLLDLYGTSGASVSLPITFREDREFVRAGSQELKGLVDS